MSGDGTLPDDVAALDEGRGPGLDGKTEADVLSAPTDAGGDPLQDLPASESRWRQDLPEPDIIPESPDIIPAQWTPPDVELPPGESCGDIWNCGLMLGCFESDGACWQPCLEGADFQALQEFGDMLDCFQESCAWVPDQQQGECLWSECSGAIFQCLGGEGTSDCVETLECLGDCDQDDGLCFFACMEMADQDAVDMIAAMNSGDDSTMFYYLVLCAGGQGDADCGQTFVCMQDCGALEDDQDGMTCMLDCLDQSSPEAQEKLLDAMACGDDACMDVIIECVGGQGAFSCGEVFVCLMDCGEQPEDPAPEPDDEPPEDDGGDCSMECIGQSSPEGAEDLVEFFLCLEEMCQGQPDDCPEAMACIASCPGLPLGF